MNGSDELNKANNLKLLMQVSLLRQAKALSDDEYREIVNLAKRAMRMDGFTEIIRKKLCDAAQKRQSQTGEADYYARSIMAVVNSIN